MNKAAIFAAALALTLSLTACGNQDKNNGQTPNNQPNTNGTVENGGNSNGTNNNGTNSNGTNSNGTNSNGTNSSNNGGSLTDPSNTPGIGSGTGTGNNTGTQSRSSVGNDLRRAADNVGDAVTDLVDDGRGMMSRATNATSFEQMLDNARVHDTDGVLTDNENSRW